MMMDYFISWLFEGAFHVDTHVIQNRKHYACTTGSSPLADRFHTKMGACFAFT